MTFVLLQGSFNSYNLLKTEWLPRFQAALEPLGHKILLPELPFDNWDEVKAAGEGATPKQSLDSWTVAFDLFYPQIAQTKDLVFVGHSLGTLFTLHVVEKFNLQLDSAIFVCPFLLHLEKSEWPINLVNKTFYKSNFDFVKLQKLIPQSFVLYGTDDPYVETVQSLMFAKQLSSSVIGVVGGGHLNKAENVDLILELAKTRISR